MERFLNNQTEVVKKLKKSDRKKLGFSVELPDVYLDENGDWQSYRNIVISSYAEFCEYAKKHEEIIQFLKSNYPEVVSVIWKNAFSEFSSTKCSTIAGKLLSGEKISSTKLLSAASSSDSKNAIRGILRRLNFTKSGIKGEKVTLPVMKKTKKEVMSLLESSSEGYYLPELDENGMVVLPVDKTHFAGNFFAVNASEVTEEQVREYLAAPIVNSKVANKNNLDLLVTLSKEIYRKIGKPEMTSWVRMMLDTCADVYPLSFTEIQDKKSRKQEIVNEPVILPMPEEGNKPVVVCDDFDLPVENDEDLLSLENDDEPLIPENDDDMFAPENFDESAILESDDEQKQKDVGISKIVIEGKTVSETDVNEEGKLIMSISNRDGLTFTFVLSEDEKGKILHAKPVSEKEF